MGGLPLHFETNMYNEIIEKFIAAQKAARKAYQEASHFERETLAGTGTVEPFFAVEVRSDYREESELEKFCFALASNVVSRARREFAPVGAQLDIDNNTEYERAGVDIGKALKDGAIPDLDKIWSSLKAYYHGDGGATTAYRQAATRIVSTFGLNRNAEVKRTSSGVMLKKNVFSESGWRSSGRRRVGYHSSQRTADCLSGLATFAGKAGHAQLAGKLKSINVHELEYVSREKLNLPALDITFYNDKWEFRFSHELGEALMLFIGEFGQEAMQDRH